MTTINSRKKIVQFYWLCLAIGCLILVAIFWLKVDKEVLYQPETPIEAQVIEEVSPEKVANNRTLGAFANEVPALELKKRKIALNNNHLAQFRGTTYFQRNSKMWLVELFRAKEEAVVISYFKFHREQDDLYYTRLSGDEQEEQYLVFYYPKSGLKTENSALLAMNKLEGLALPASVTPSVHQFKEYVNSVNEVGSEESMSGYTKVNEVRVSAVANPSTSSQGYQTPATSQNSQRYVTPPAVDPAPRIVRHDTQ